MTANSIHDIEYFALNVQPLAVKSYCRALTDTRSAPSRAKKQRTKLDTEDSSSGDNSNTESSDMSGADAGSKKAKKKAGYSTNKLVAIASLTPFLAIERVVEHKTKADHRKVEELGNMIFACDPEEIALDFAKLTMLQVFASDLAKGSKPSPARKQVCNVFKKARAIIGTPHHCHVLNPRDPCML